MKMKSLLLLILLSGSSALSEELKTSVSLFKLGTVSQGVVGGELSGYKANRQSLAVGLESVLLSPGPWTHFAFDSPEFAYLTSVQGKLSKTPMGDYEWSFEDENVALTRTFRGSETNPYLDVVYKATFKKKRPNQAFIVLAGANSKSADETIDHKLLYYMDSKVQQADYKPSPESVESSGKVDWIGISSRYFVFAAVPKEGSPKAVVQQLGDNAGLMRGRVSLVYAVSDSSITIPFRLYFGPKDLTLLKQTEPKLDQALDLGFFTIVAYPLLRLLKWFYSYVHNYGLAIILLTLVVRAIMVPLVIKSSKSMKTMAKLQPEMQRIREKYKDDKQAQNVEMMAFLKSNNYNPMAGCLPILVQIPVFFALYRVLYSAVELYQAPFIFWIHDLSYKDPYYVTPVLLSLVMFMQQKITPMTTTDPFQKKMMLYMPLIFGVFMLSLPSGLTLYMLVSGVFGVIQQGILNRQFAKDA